MSFTVGEVSEMLGLSIRALRYYDEIGLVHPARTSEAGYRLYDKENLTRLQEVLFFRSLGFSLSETGDILSSPGYDRDSALKKRLELLLLEKKRLDETIEAVKNTINGDDIMKNKNNAAREFDAAREKYAAEVKEKWGGTKEFEQSEKKMSSLDDKGKGDFLAGSDEIFAAFAAIRTSDPAGAEAAALVARWQKFISDNCYECTKPILQGLGLMYVGDSRFTENLDRFGEGTAQFMSDAIAAYCK